MMNRLDVQRLVDGECSHHERAELLASIGNDASLWRTLAIRLLEDQVLQRELSSVPPPSESVVKIRNQQVQNSTPNEVFHLIPVIAASILFVSLGFWSGRHYSIDSAFSVVDSTKGNIESSTVLEDLIPTGRMKFKSLNDDDAPWEAPVFEVSRLDPSWLARRDAAYLSEINAKLLNRGWNALLDTEIYEGELPDGRRMIVPIKNISFEPIGY